MRQVQNVVTLRAALLDVMRPFCGAGVADNQATRDALAAAVGRQFSGKGSRQAQAAVGATIKLLPAGYLCESKLRLLSRLWAGNVERLRRGEPVLPWVTQLVDERVLCRIDSALNIRRLGAYAWQLELDVLVGTSAGTTPAVTLSNAAAARLARILGFSRRGGKYAMTVVPELVNCIAAADIVAAECRGGSFSVSDWVELGAIQQTNRELMQIRTRQRPCPRNYEHECYRCAVGSDACVAATHRCTYVRGVCGCCNDTAAVLDPARPGRCIDCDQKERMSQP